MVILFILSPYCWLPNPMLETGGGTNTSGESNCGCGPLKIWLALLYVAESDMRMQLSAEDRKMRCLLGSSYARWHDTAGPPSNSLPPWPLGPGIAMRFEVTKVKKTI